MSKEAEGQNPTTSKHLPKTYIKAKHPPAHDLGSVKRGYCCRLCPAGVRECRLCLYHENNAPLKVHNKITIKMKDFLKSLKLHITDAIECIGCCFGHFSNDTEIRAQQRKQEQARAKAQMMARYAYGIDKPYVWQESKTEGFSFKIKDGYYELTVDKPANNRKHGTRCTRERMALRRKRQPQPPVVPNIVINISTVSISHDTHNFYASVGQVANNMSNNIKEQQKGE